MKKSVSITYVLVDETIHFENLRPYLQYLTLAQQKQVERYHLEQDKITCLIAKLLIKKQASEDLKVPFDKIQVSYKPFGKPYLPNYPNYHFSISHSHHCVAFGWGKEPIGVDVEYVASSKLNEEVAKTFFAPKELQAFLSSPSQEMTFHEIWTQKEAYVKMLGTGMATSLLSFDVKEEKLKKSLLSTYDLGYWFSACSQSFQNHELILEELSLLELLDFFNKHKDLCNFC